jgi:predicted XRE-type DNA-binding protein
VRRRQADGPEEDLQGLVVRCGSGEQHLLDRSQVMKKTMRKLQTEASSNVFIDLGFPPHEAAVMLLRCELAEALRKWIDREGITQAQAAERLGVAQPRISEIARNKVDRLSLDYLVGLCAKAGVAVKVKTAA